MPVKGDQRYIQPVEYHPDHRQHCGPPYQNQVFLPYAQRIEKTGQPHKSQQFHQVPDAVTRTEQVPVVSCGYPDDLDDKVTCQHKRSGFSKAECHLVFFFQMNGIHLVGIVSVGQGTFKNDHGEPRNDTADEKVDGQIR